MEGNIIPKFIRVRKIDSHFNVLYNILKSRKHNISHHKIPTFYEHKLFVINNPYRAWFLIKVGENYIGTLYILKDNCIGIYVVNDDELIIKNSISWIQKQFKPLQAIKSVRAPHFHINLSPKNINLISILESMGATQIQITFAFNKSQNV